jgi:hypothetical protein
VKNNSISLEIGFQHLGKMEQQHRSPDVVGEMQEKGCFPAERLGVGEIIIVCIFQLSDVDEHTELLFGSWRG